MRALIYVSWALWGTLVLALGFTMLRATTERVSSPELAAGAGWLLGGLLALVLGGLGVALHGAAARGSARALVALALLLAWPVTVLVARPVVMWVKERRGDRARPPGPPPGADRGG